MKVIFSFFCVGILSLSLCGCESLKKRNIALYEQKKEAEEVRDLPSEPTLEVKRVDSAKHPDSILNDDGLNDAERAYMNKVRDEDKKAILKRRKKLFGGFAK